MAHYKVKTTFERIHRMDDVLVPRRSVVIRGQARSPNFLSLLLVVLVSSVSIAGAASSGTLSFFTDAEQSTGNFFVADPIYFSVVASSTEQTFIGAQINTDAPIVLTTMPGETSDPVQFYVRAQMTGGNGAFCNALTATGDAPLTYSGPLLSLDTGTTSVMGPWNLFVSLPDPPAGLADGDTCSLDIVYTGWNDGLPEGGGYTDIHHVPLVFVFEEATSTPSVGAPSDTAPVPGAPQADAPSGGGAAAPADAISGATATSSTSDATTTPDISTADAATSTPASAASDAPASASDTSATSTPALTGDSTPQTDTPPAPAPDAPPQTDTGSAATPPPDTAPPPPPPAPEAPAPDAPATP